MQGSRSRMAHLTALALLPALLPVLLMPPAAESAEAVYRWVDDDGVVHYSQQAPRGIDAERVAPGRANTVSMPGAARQSEDAPDPEAERRRELDQAAQERLRKVSARRAENCRQARTRFEQLTTHPRIRLTDEEGNTRMLTEEERQSRIERARDAIIANCEDGAAIPEQPAGR